MLLILWYESCRLHLNAPVGQPDDGNECLQARTGIVEFFWIFVYTFCNWLFETEFSVKHLDLNRNYILVSGRRFLLVYLLKIMKSVISTHVSVDAPEFTEDSRFNFCRWNFSNNSPPPAGLELIGIVELKLE